MASLHFVQPHTDLWRTAPDDPCPQPAAGLLLQAAQWEAVRASWPAELPIGVLWPNDRDIAALAPDLPRLDLIALQFPKWTDGRAYSQARWLRGRQRWLGHLRAVGDIIADMALPLWRCGFDSAVLRPGESVQVAQRALQAFDGFYQSDLRFLKTATSSEHA
jgi:uncharacterized protein (DUF934 family)